MFIPLSNIEMQLMTLILENSGQLTLKEIINTVRELDEENWKTTLTNVLKRKNVKIEVQDDFILSYVVPPKKRKLF